MNRSHSAAVDTTEIAVGLLVFKPAPDANGVSHARLTFRVRDDGGADYDGDDMPMETL